MAPDDPAPEEALVRVKIMSGKHAGTIVDQPRTVAEVSIQTGYAELASEPPAIVVTRLEPPGALCGSPDLTLHVYGTGFTASSRILFNGSEELTTYVSSTELTTGVKPSLAPLPVAVPVSVVGAATSVDFTFTGARAAGPSKGAA